MSTYLSCEVVLIEEVDTVFGNVVGIFNDGLNDSYIE